MKFVIKPIFIFFIFFNSCFNGSKQEIVYPKLDLVEKIAFRPLRNGADGARFGIRNLRLDSNEYLVYLKKDSTIQFENIGHSEKSYSVGFPISIKNNQTYAIYLGDSLFYLLVDSYIEKTRPAEMYVFKLTNEKKYELIKSWNMEELFDLKYYYFNFQQGALIISDSSAYIAYGARNEKNNYLDDYAYIKVRLDSLTPHSYKKIFSFPNEFKRWKYRNYDTWLQKVNDSTLLLGFASMDSIVVANSKDDILKRKLFNKNSGYRKFDKTKAMDLGYLRWYDATNEKNEQIFCSNDEIYIIKRKAKKEITEMDRYEYYVLNMEGDIICHATFDLPVYPISFSYKKGFIILNSTADTALYYAKK